MLKKKNHKNIVILTGAGISAESGIKTFRDSNGLWENHDIIEVASPMGFERDPTLVHTFYNKRREQLQSDEVAPNDAHIALAELESHSGVNVTIVTQNVDNLHERAGSKEVIHMHGELLKVRCSKTKQVFDELGAIYTTTKCPCCDESDNLRPHIVWFGEVPMLMGKIEKLLNECDLFISIGTSGLVYPAAMFVQIANQNGNECQSIEINLEGTDVTDDFDTHICGKASVEVRKLVTQILAK